MDVNAVYACIGYGASRAVASEGFRHGEIQIPARYIMETAKDPVKYCLDALASHDPEAAALFDGSARDLILARLKREARLSHH